MEKLFELTFQDQTLNPQVGTFTDASQAAGTFTLEDGEYYLTNADTKGFYAYSPVAMQSGVIDDSKVIIEFDLKVVTASVNTRTIIGTYAGVDGNGIPTGDKITLQYNAGDIELVLGSGATATLIEAADVVVDQWYHFRIDCMLAALTGSTYKVKIDGVLITTVTGAAADYALGVISVLGTDLHACDECGIKNITLVTETNMFVGRTALDQALQDVKGYVDNQVGACVPLAGSNQISGSLIPATTDAYDLGGSSYQWNNAYIKALTINGVACGDILTHNASEFVPRSGGAVLDGDEYAQTVTNSRVAFRGGTSSSTGGTLYANGKDYLIKAGYAGLIAINDNNSSGAELDPAGNFILTADSFEIVKSNSDGGLRLSGGTSYHDGGGGLALHGKNRPNSPSAVVIFSHSDGGTDKLMWLKPDGTWTWNGQPVQYVSDQRYKQQITEIDDKLLDAWEDVDLVQFKYNESVDTKGKSARLHTGYVVQQIDSACKSHNVDISAYGLYCHEEYPEETEEVEVEQADGTKTKERKVIREASEHYSLRYTEAYAIECKYLRRCVKQLTARIEQLTARIEELEKGKGQEDSK